MAASEPSRLSAETERDVLVAIDAAGAAAADVLISVDSALGARPRGVRVVVLLASGAPGRVELDDLLGPDARVTLAVTGDATGPAGEALVVELPAGVELERETLEAIERELSGGGELTVAVPRHPARLSGVDPVARRAARRRIRARAGGGGAKTIGVHRLGKAGGGLAGEPGTLALSDLAGERGEHLRNRARSATYRSRYDAVAQVLARDRLRTRHERARVTLFEQRLAEVSPKAWAAWRSRQARDAAAVVPGAVRSGSRSVKQQGRRVRRFAIDKARSRGLSSE